MFINIFSFYENLHSSNSVTYPTPPNQIIASPQTFDWLTIFYLAQDALRQSNTHRGTIYFPQGSYYFSRTMQIFINCTLTGDGPDYTHIYFDWGLDNNLPDIANYPPAETPYYKWLDGIVYHSGGAGNASNNYMYHTTANLPAPYRICVPMPNGFQALVDAGGGGGNGLTIEKLSLEFLSAGNVIIPQPSVIDITADTTYTNNAALVAAFGTTGISPRFGHGICLHMSAYVQHCKIKGFIGNGIHISSNTFGATVLLEQYANLYDIHTLPIPTVTGSNVLIAIPSIIDGFLPAANGGGKIPGSNANGCTIQYVTIEHCHANGVYTLGGDSNICQFLSLQIKHCGQWGVLECSDLGNLYSGCHANDCAQGGYKSTNAPVSSQDADGQHYIRSINNASSFINCFTNGKVQITHYKQQWIGGTAPTLPDANNPKLEGIYWLNNGYALNIGKSLLFQNNKNNSSARLNMGSNEEKCVLAFNHVANGLDSQTWTLGYDGGYFAFKQNSVAGLHNNELSLTTAATPNLPQGNAYYPNKFYFLTDNNNQHQSVATYNGMPPVYFNTEDNPPQVTIETGEIKYLPWRFAQIGDIVFNTKPVPGDNSPQKFGYVGYICVQNGIPEIDENNYILLNLPGEEPELDAEGKYKVIMAQPAKWKCFGKILVILLFYLTMQSNYAQGWAKIYSSCESNSNFAGFAVEENGTYLAIANLCNNERVLWRIDENGGIQNEYPLSLPIGGLYRLTDDNYLTTYNGKLVKITPIGDTVWTTPPMGNIYFDSIVNEPDGSFICNTNISIIPPNGNEFISAYRLIKTSNDGIILADTILYSLLNNIPVNTYPQKLLRDGNGNLLIASVQLVSPPIVEIMKVSTSNFGEIIWSNNKVEGIGTDIVELEDGNYLVSATTIDGKVKLIKYSSIGDTLWTKKLSTPSQSNTLNLYQISSNEFAISATPLNLQKTDSLGNELVYKNYGYLNLDIGSNFAYSKNNEYIGGLKVVVNGIIHPFLLKTDSLGNCTPKAQFSLNQTDSLVSVSNTSFGADSYEWLWGNGTTLQDTTQQTQSYIYPQTGIYNLCLVAHNLCGNDTLCQTINYGVVDGVGNLSQNLMFSLLSNPVSQPIMYLKHPPLTAAATATIYNLNGQAIAQQTLLPNQTNSQINVSLLPAGVYLLQIQGQNIWWQQKVVVIR